MTELYRAMISSTTKDMLVHRQQAQDACLRQDFFPVMMEHLPPSPDDAVRRSLSLVDGADVYVLVLGLRYGEIPGGYEKSYTHLELDRAIERGIPILVLLTTGRSVQELRTLRAPERGEELLDILDREPYLVVLDGVERLLLAYSRSDASRLADDDLDEQTAHRVAGAMGLPPSAAASFRPVPPADHRGPAHRGIPAPAGRAAIQPGPPHEPVVPA